MTGKKESDFVRVRNLITDWKLDRAIFSAAGQATAAEEMDNLIAEAEKLILDREDPSVGVLCNRYKSRNAPSRIISRRLKKSYFTDSYVDGLLIQRMSSISCHPLRRLPRWLIDRNVPPLILL